MVEKCLVYPIGLSVGLDQECQPRVLADRSLEGCTYVSRPDWFVAGGCASDDHEVLGDGAALETS